MTRHTKIIATLGPASSEPATLDALVAAGVDVFRLNFSHGTHEAHAEVFRQGLSDRGLARASQANQSDDRLPLFLRRQERDERHIESACDVRETGNGNIAFAGLEIGQESR